MQPAGHSLDGMFSRVNLSMKFGTSNSAKPAMTSHRPALAASYKSSLVQLPRRCIRLFSVRVR
jgi:hypothetical protein